MHSDTGTYLIQPPAILDFVRRLHFGVVIGRPLPISIACGSINIMRGALLRPSIIENIPGRQISRSILVLTSHHVYRSECLGSRMMPSSSSSSERDACVSALSSVPVETFPPSDMPRKSGLCHEILSMAAVFLVRCRGS